MTSVKDFDKVYSVILKLYISILFLFFFNFHSCIQIKICALASFLIDSFVLYIIYNFAGNLY